MFAARLKGRRLLAVVRILSLAPCRKDADAFYALALEQTGAYEGRPGLRPQIDENYYAAFVRDSGENKIEAVSK